MIKRICKTYLKTISEIYPSTSYSEFSVQFFFNRMGSLFNYEDHLYFHIYIHISKTIVHDWVDASSQWPALQLA